MKKANRVNYKSVKGAPDRLPSLPVHKRRDRVPRSRNGKAFTKSKQMLSLSMLNPLDFISNLLLRLELIVKNSYVSLFPDVPPSVTSAFLVFGYGPHSSLPPFSYGVKILV